MRCLAVPRGREQQTGLCGCGSRRAARKRGPWFWSLKGAGEGGEGAVAKGIAPVRAQGLNAFRLRARS